MSFRVFYKLPREGFWQQNSIKVSLCLFFVPVLPAKAAAPTANPCAALPVQELPWELLKNWEIFIRTQQIQHCSVSIEHSWGKAHFRASPGLLSQGMGRSGSAWGVWISLDLYSPCWAGDCSGSLQEASAVPRLMPESHRIHLGWEQLPKGREGGRSAQLPAPAWASKHSLPWPLWTHLLEKGGHKSAE